MDDLMFLKYLKEKGILTEEVHSEILADDPAPEKMHHKEMEHDSDIYTEFFDYFKKVTSLMNKSEKDHFIDRLKEFDNKPSKHFDEDCARWTVSKMWHIVTDGSKCMGEVFPMSKAKKVLSEHPAELTPDVTVGDVYVAINSQYHDYGELFKKWFGDSRGEKIIESALTFWFNDDDSSHSKLWDYFKE